MKTYRIKYPLVVLAMLVLGVSCKTKVPKAELSTPTSGEVSILADESIKPVVEPLLQVFNGIYPFASVHADYQTETEVLNALLKFETPMILATRCLTQKEKDYFLSKKYFPRENIFGTDAIALIVNPMITDSLLSVGQIRDILTGRISTWAQLGIQSNTDSIHVVFDQNGSSTVRFMIDSICQGKPFIAGLNALQGNREVIEYVANNPRSLGIIGVSWISDSRDPASLTRLKKVKVMRVSRITPAAAENSFLPYQAFIGDRTYPLYRNIYVINAEPRNGLATGVASFVCSDRGQRIILKTGIMPFYQTPRNVKITD